MTGHSYLISITAFGWPVLQAWQAFGSGFSPLSGVLQRFPCWIFRPQLPKQKQILFAGWPAQSPLCLCTYWYTLWCLNADPWQRGAFIVKTLLKKSYANTLCGFHLWELGLHTFELLTKVGKITAQRKCQPCAHRPLDLSRKWVGDQFCVCSLTLIFSEWS